MASLAWRAKSFPAYRSFREYLARCRMAQTAYLLRLLDRNRDCAYGRRYGFSAINTVGDFQDRVPLTRYEDYCTYIERIADGKHAVLTNAPVLLFEPSSGTTSGRKLVPYTCELKREFQRGIGPWIVSLYSQFPALASGRAYWSISPPQDHTGKKHGAIPVGFDNDWGYLGTVGKVLHSCVAVSPEGMLSSDDAGSFRNATLASLMAAEDLRLISVWSPSFLRIMLDWYTEHQDDVLETMSLLGTARERVSYLRGLGTGEGLFEHVWPELTVVSCWADAASAREAGQLARRLPHARIQGKGLISTEAFVSLPFLADRDPVLAVQSHFFEFMTDNGDLLLADQLERGREYSVVVTTGGGFYRYCLADRIVVTGFVGNTPTIRFVGKTDLVSDYYGEKLNSSHVSRAVDSLLRDREVRFAMLAPDRVNGSCSYTLYVQCERELPQGLREKLDRLLRNNPNYRYCISLGQLSPARVFRLQGDPCAVFEATCAADGQRRGDIKPVPLSKRQDWSARFEGDYV